MDDVAIIFWDVRDGHSLDVLLEKSTTVTACHACLMAAVKLRETQDNTYTVIGALSHLHKLKCFKLQQFHSLRLKMGLEGTMTGANPFFQYTLVSPKCDQEAKKKADINKHRSRGTKLCINYSRDEVTVKGKRKQGDGQCSHIVGAQRDPASTASAEFSLAVGAKVATAVCKLGLAADTAGGRVIFLLGLLTPRLRPNATHLLFVALKLLVQCSERRGQKSLAISGTSFTHTLFVLTLFPI